MIDLYFFFLFFFFCHFTRVLVKMAKMFKMLEMLNTHKHYSSMNLGTFGNKPGLPSMSYCQKCPNGFFCPAGCVEPMAKPTARPTRRPTTRRPVRPTTRRPVRPTPGRGWSGERRRFSMRVQLSLILSLQSANCQAPAGWFVFDWLAYVSRNFSLLPSRINLWYRSKSWALV